jgi:putative hemolysin
MEILIIVLLTLFNGVLAMSEAAILAARKTRLQQLADEGDQRAKITLAMAQDPNRFLSTVQIGITLVGILAGAFGGATVAESIARQLETIPALVPYSVTIGVLVVVLFTTYLSLVIGELVPKRLALQNPERIAMMVAPWMARVSGLTGPFVRLLGISTDFVLRLTGVQASGDPPISEEEIRVLIRQGVQAGVFEQAEENMVAGVFKLVDRRINMMMTPRTEIEWLDLNDALEVNRQIVMNSPHSRFPVGRGSLDNLQGIVRAKELLNRSLSGQEFDLMSILREPLVIPETAAASHALELFKQSNTHIALVLGEHGGIEGLITMNNLIEEIIGSVDEPEGVQREDGSWLFDGLMAVDEFKEMVGVKALPEEEEGHYQTLGGFVMAQLGHIPKAADHFEWEGLRFEVMDMDGMRVDKVLVAKSEAPPDDSVDDELKG